MTEKPRLPPTPSQWEAAQQALKVIRTWASLDEKDENDPPLLHPSHVKALCDKALGKTND